MPKNWLSPRHPATKEFNQNFLKIMVKKIFNRQASIYQSLKRIAENYRLNVIIYFAQNKFIS